MSLITVAEARTWTAFPAGTEADAILTLLCDSVSADCEKYIAGPVASTALDRYIDGDGSDFLILPVVPVIALTTLTIQGGANLVEGWDKDFTLTKSTGKIRLTAGLFPRYAGAVHAVWSAGYSPVPADIKVSIMKGVAFGYFAQDKRRQGLTTFTSPSGDVQTYTELAYPKDVTSVWERYRQVTVG